MKLKIIMMLFLAFTFCAAAVWAYSSDARNSLLKSRDQVADQQTQLEKADNEIDRRIEELQKQKFAIGQYLKESDKTLHDLDRALNAQDSAYRNR